VKTKENTTMPDDHLAGLEERYRHGYTWRQCEGDVAVALLGATPRHYGDVMLLTRANDHPNPDTAPPAVVLARNDFGLAVVELFDLPITAERTVVDLTAERHRRRATKAGEGA
jgi:hypothetical protein